MTKESIREVFKRNQIWWAYSVLQRRHFRNKVPLPESVGRFRQVVNKEFETKLKAHLFYFIWVSGPEPAQLEGLEIRPCSEQLEGLGTKPYSEQLEGLKRPDPALNSSRVSGPEPAPNSSKVFVWKVPKKSMKSSYRKLYFSSDDL